ncbi:MAG: hypothetical protein ACLGHN_13815 [Bacteriovoracia bacterium]
MNEEKKIKNVTVPLKVEELKELIEKKDSFYIVNYKESQLRDIVFLNYVSNLNLPCEVLIEGCDYLEKQSLLKAYLTTRNIVTINSLRLNIAMLLLENRGMDTANVFVNPLFTREEAKTFITDNKEVIERWEQFIESTMIFALYTAKDLNDEMDVKSQVRIVDDPNYVGSNIVNMFSIPSFMELFFLTPPKHELCFFQPQFEEYMFKGKNLYEYYFCEENDIYKLFITQVHGGTSFEEIENAFKEAKAIRAANERLEK